MTHNPSFGPAQATGAASGQGTQYYIVDRKKPDQAVKAGKYLEMKVWEEFGLSKARADGAGEWYRIRDLEATTGHGLAQVLHQMSIYVGQQTSLGYVEALAVSNRGGSLQQQRDAATAAIKPHSTALFNMIKNGPYA